MKVLFTGRVLEDVLDDRGRSGDTRALLNMCQEGQIEGYVCSYHLIDLSRQMDRRTARKFLAIMGRLIRPVHANMFDIREALEKDDFESALEIVVAVRHRLDCVVTTLKKQSDDSTIEIYDPMELRRRIENGKESQQRRDL